MPEAIVMDDDNSPATINQEDVKGLDSILEQLIKLIEHFMERMKTNDLQQEQLELAYLIGSLWGQKKVKYYMVYSLIIRNSNYLPKLNLNVLNEAIK